MTLMLPVVPVMIAAGEGWPLVIAADWACESVSCHCGSV